MGFLVMEREDERNHLITVALLGGSSQQKKCDQVVPMQRGMEGGSEEWICEGVNMQGFHKKYLLVKCFYVRDSGKR